MSNSFDVRSAYMHVDPYTNTFIPFSNKVYAKLLASKRVSKTDVKLSDIEYLMKLVDAINSLDRYDICIDNRPLSEIHIASWMRQLIYPTRVIIAAGFGYKDMLDKPTFPKDFVYNEGKVRAIYQLIAATVKEQESVITVDSVRKEQVGLSWDAISFENHASASAKGFIPLPVKPETAHCLVSENAFPDSAGDIVTRYIIEELSFSSKGTLTEQS